jgi:tetratricopeptide (TPR) repeat protein
MTQAHEGQSTLEAAELLLEASRYRAACSAFAGLAHTDAHSATAHVGWGQALKGLENYDEAASRFEKAIAADPADDRAFDELGEIWEHLSKRDALLARIQHRLDAIKAPGAHRAWAAFLSRIGLHQRELAEYDRAARAKKRDVDFLLRRGKASADTGLHEQALERFIGAIPAVAAEGRHDRDCFDLVANSLRALGTPDHQVARIQTCVDAVDSHAIRLRWAQALLALDRAAASADQIKKVILVVDNAEGWRTWGEALVALDAEDDAMSKRCLELAWLRGSRRADAEVEDCRSRYRAHPGDRGQGGHSGCARRMGSDIGQSGSARVGGRAVRGSAPDLGHPGLNERLGRRTRTAGAQSRCRHAAGRVVRDCVAQKRASPHAEVQPIERFGLGEASA